MTHKQSRLLTAEEQWDIYDIPTLSAIEIDKYFTLNDIEIKTLKSFETIESSVYFAICYIFLTLKNTLVNFSYQEVTQERQYIMKRYFPTKKAPRSFPKNKTLITRIENKALALYRYSRVNQQNLERVKSDLRQQATQHPRQRKLCKTLLDLLTKYRIAIPPYSNLQTIVSEVWQHENERIIKRYQRHTTKAHRQIVLSLLKKTDKFHRIVTIHQDMKNFTNTEINKEIKKLQDLTPIFDIAKMIIPKLQLPITTINYYASLIDYYNGYRLNQLNSGQVQLYLLCYTFSRYPVLNDNLLEALKKRTLEYQSDATQYAKNESVKQLELTKNARENASNLLIAIHDYSGKSIPKSEIYKHIVQNELLNTAHLLVDNHLDKHYLFWKYIDRNKDAMKLSLRLLFSHLDLLVINNESLKKIIDFLKTRLNSAPSKQSDPLPSYVVAWIKKKDKPYVIKNESFLFNRLEFLIYKNIVHHISTNKLTIKHSIKHKPIIDDLLPKEDWNKNKNKIVKKTGYKKLNKSAKKILKEKCDNINKLYKKLNEGILSGKNEGIKITTGKNGKVNWRLRPLDKKSDPNDSLFKQFNRRSIVDVIKFVNEKTLFSRAFDPILAKQTRGENDIMHIIAVTLANAIRVGSRKMADISDLNQSALLSAEANYFRSETLLSAIDIINKAATQFPIYKQWYINNQYHGSADGLKLEVELQNIMARYSKKYFGNAMGVSGYNSILNHFSITGMLIGTNEYEGHYTFEMAEHQNAEELKINVFSVDDHGTNAFNSALFDLTERLLAPRIPKPHREKFWGFEGLALEKNYIIKPTDYVDMELIIEEWDNILHLITSLITGEAQPSVIIRKLSSGNYNSRTKLALMHYNHLVKTEFLLMYLHDKEFQRAITTALNRGEHFNNLYRAITLLKKGTFKGKNKIEMQMWNHCTRLISSVILYYNSYILNGLYQNTANEKTRNYLAKLSPAAWIHVNLLGYYQFIGEGSYEYIERWIDQWRYSGGENFVENLEEELLI